MKNIKRLVLVAMLAASIAFVMASCGNNAGGNAADETGRTNEGTQKPSDDGSKESGGSVFEMNEEQKKHYDGFIQTLETSALLFEMLPEVVKQQLDSANNDANKLGFKIEDTQAGKPIPEGTKADVLKKRFVPKKA